MFFDGVWWKTDFGGFLGGCVLWVKKGEEEEADHCFKW